MVWLGDIRGVTSRAVAGRDIIYSSVLHCVTFLHPYTPYTFNTKTGYTGTHLHLYHIEVRVDSNYRWETTSLTSWIASYPEDKHRHHAVHARTYPRRPQAQRAPTLDSPNIRRPRPRRQQALLAQRQSTLPQQGHRRPQPRPAGQKRKDSPRGVGASIPSFR